MEDNNNEVPDFIKRLLSELEGQYNNKKAEEKESPQAIMVHYGCSHLPHPAIMQIIGQFNMCAS